MIRLFLFMFGFGLSVLGFMYMILYLNLLTIDYTFAEYIKFIFTKCECIQGFIGIIIIFVTIFYKGDNNDLHL